MLLSRCVALFHGRKLDEELDEELRAHIELAVEENIKRGISEAEARRAAMVEFGGLTQTKETYRTQQSLPFLQTLAMDARYGLRQLHKSPAFAATAILTLGLGIGGVTAAFSVVEAVLLRPLPFPDSDRLISLHESVKEDPHDFNVTAPDVLIFQRESKAFSGEGGYIGAAYDVTGSGRAVSCGGGEGDGIAVSRLRRSTAAGSHVHAGRGCKLLAGDRDQFCAVAGAIPG